MTDGEESAYIRGQKSAWLNVIRQAMRELVIHEPNCADPELLAARAVTELADARETVRQLSERHGVQYDPKLYLSDAIEKRLVRHLEHYLRASFASSESMEPNS